MSILILHKIIKNYDRKNLSLAKLLHCKVFILESVRIQSPWETMRSNLANSGSEPCWPLEIFQKYSLKEKDGDFGKEKAWLSYLCSTTLFVSYKPLSSTAKWYIVARHPLVRVVTSLSADPRYDCVGSKVHLKPLSVVTRARAPGSSVSSSTALVKPGISCCAVVVVWRRGSEHWVWDATVF